jgi:fructose-1,6-bisphosphatase/inositol monophosphatase family enzyme
LETEIKVAQKAIQNAMKVSENFLENPVILKNEFKDIKTLVDLKINESIIHDLSKSNIPIISEELNYENFELPKKCWIIDPLDGTFNFTRKFPVVGISIALFIDGNPVLGIVQDIFNKSTYLSELGSGANKNDFKINVSNISELKNAILATGFPSGTSYESKELFEFVSLVQKFKKIRAIGCASLMLSYVAEGIFDVYYEKDIYLWDVAAGLSLVKESGGEIFYQCTDGKFKYEVLASNKKIFKESKKLLIKTI